MIYETEDLRMADRKDGHATLSVDRAHGKAGEVAVPGDEIAAGAGDGSRLVASQADREQVLDALKAAFVHGRLAKDEFDLRVGKVLATYAELDALTADIPAALTAAQPSGPARESHNKRLVQRGTAAGAGASVVFAGASVLVANGSPVLGLVIGGVAGAFMTVLLAGLLTLLSWVLEKGSGRRPSRGLPPGASGRTSPPPIGILGLSMPGSITDRWRIGFEVSQRNAACQIRKLSCLTSLRAMTVEPTNSTGANRCSAKRRSGPSGQ